MALSGSYTYIVPNTVNTISLKIDWTATQNVAKNTSTVTATFHFNIGKYGPLYASTRQAWTVTVAGQSWSGTAVLGGGSYSSKQIARVTKEVAHRADGTQSFGITYKQNLNFYWGNRYISSATTGSRGFSLNTIPRASSFSSISNITLGQNVNVNIANHANFTHNIALSIPGHNNIQGWTGIGGGTQTLTFNGTTTKAISALLASSTSTKLSWSMSTNSGSTQIGSVVTGSSTVSLPSGETTPSVGDVTFKEANANIMGRLTGGSFVQGLSRLVFTVANSSATHGATIKSTKVTLEGKDYASGETTNAIAGSGTVNAVASVTDTRGTTATKNIPITVIPYFMPKVTGLEITRANADGKYQTDGTYANLAYTSITATDIPFANKSKNTVSIEVMAMNPDGTGQGVTPSIALDKNVGGPTIAKGTMLLSGTYETSVAYGFQVTIVDDLGGTTHIELSLGVAHVIMGWGKSAVGIGKIPEQGALDIYGDTYYQGDQYFVSELVSGTKTAVKRGDSLWVGVLNMNSKDTITPTRKIEECPNGWLMMWQNYSTGKVTVDGGYYVTPIWKDALAFENGNAVNIPLWNYGGTLIHKYMYVFHDHISGNDMSISGAGKDYVCTHLFAF